MTLKILSEQRCFEGTQGFYEHQSAVTGTRMRFGVYQPPQARKGRQLPVLLYLPGLTCTQEVFFIKAGAQRFAVEHEIILVAPDASPRDTGIPQENADWEFGAGASYYMDATAEPWGRCYKMYSYVVEELPWIVAANFPVDPHRRSIMGHSMGGHGALTIALNKPTDFRSVSAFSPICAPLQCSWGMKAINGFLGGDTTMARRYDTTALIEDGARYPGKLLIDQGEADNFLVPQLKPELLEAACAKAGQPIEMRRRPGYDHSYYFIATFIRDHIEHHAAALSSH
jgi:S-formylglutathione hydrolase